jgi:hypothetical protein
MKKCRRLLRCIGSAFACMVFFVAQAVSTQFSFIYYQDEIPEKVKALRK